MQILFMITLNQNKVGNNQVYFTFPNIHCLILFSLEKGSPEDFFIYIYIFMKFGKCLYPGQDTEVLMKSLTIKTSSYWFTMSGIKSYFTN